MAGDEVNFIYELRYLVARNLSKALNRGWKLLFPLLLSNKPDVLKYCFEKNFDNLLTSEKNFSTTFHVFWYSVLLRGETKQKMYVYG
jgi:hypothetical protein